MSQPTRSNSKNHKRSRSNFSLLRRSQVPAQPTNLAPDSPSSPVGSSRPSMSERTPSTGAMSSSPPNRAHISRQSTASAYASSPAASTKNHKSSPSLGGGMSIEQSVRKFRIFEALRSGDTSAISKAIRESADGAPRKSISSLSGTTAGGLEDTTILHLAIQCAEQPVIEYVLSEGTGMIDVNARDKEGNTPLHIAAQQGRSHIVRLLLQQKDINDCLVNYQGKLPIDLARTPDIFQQLQLSRSLFADIKIKEVQELVATGDYKRLGEVLDEPRVQTVLDVNGGEFASDPITVQAGGTLLHEAARKKNTQLIQVLLLHGADPFRRDRKGKLPQDVTKDDTTKAMLKKSPAAVAAQRGIQEKAVLGNASQQTAAAQTAPGDAVAGKEGREMKGYLKKWTNYRKGYQLRWFVLEDGVLSYYKHQDDAGSACRGAINMRIAKLSMDPAEKTKFEILGNKSSVKYHLKANHEVEAKRWFWALNNSIQWTKDQAKEEERERAKGAELLRQAKAEQSGKPSSGATSVLDLATDPDARRNSYQSTKIMPQVTLSKANSQRVAFAGNSTAGSVLDDDEGTYGSYDPSFGGDASRVTSIMGGPPIAEGDGDEDEDDYDDADGSSREAPASKDAFLITAQSAKLQLDMMTQVHAALFAEQTKKPDLKISDSNVLQAVATFDGALRSLKGLVGDLLKISRDRDAYWQYRLDREIDMRRMWEDSMAKVAREQEVLEAKMGESEEKRKMTKRALKEVINSGTRPASRDARLLAAPDDTVQLDEEGVAALGSNDKPLLRKKSALQEMASLSDSDPDEDDEEFFDAVDAGEVEVAPMPEPEPEQKSPLDEKDKLPSGVNELATVDISSSFKGYEDGIRKKLKMDADDRPKISLWGILKSMIGKDMTKMTLPVSFNEPTSLLYRCAEDMEYSDLLDIAAARPDSTERMVYVAAFAASEYASTIGRVAKPFNPLLGETFEYVRPDKNYRFFIEQVSHHPPVGAAWAESPHWTYYGESAVKSKFYGKSFDINPLGTWFLKIRPTNGDPEETYTWKKVTSSVIGIITGSPTVDNYGLMEVKNWTTGENCQVDFKPRGWKASSAYNISGRVLDSSGKPRFSLGGKWSNKIYARLTPGYEAPVDEPSKSEGKRHRRNSITDPNQAFLVWEANERPDGIPFNLTPFAVTLNDLPDRLKPILPPTDSRLRPDQRAMEDGRYDEAATEKNRVEEGQRKRRRAREEKGEEYTPRWFVHEKDPQTGEMYWKLDGEKSGSDYWSVREKVVRGEATWERCEEIFETPGDE